jgi:hypothetical protein
MCFSFRVSIITFLFTWISSLYLLTKNLKKKESQSIILLMMFGSMQLIDSILWYINMKKNLVNYIVTSFAIPIVLSMQVLYNVYIINNNHNMTLNIIVGLLICYLFVKFNGYSMSICDNYFSSPIWGGSEIGLLEMTIFLLVILYPYWSVILFTLFLIFPLIHLISKGGYGSLWCAIANILSIYNLYIYM